MIDILKLTILDAPSYAVFTYPRLRVLLGQLAHFGNVIAIGARHGSNPVGLLLAYVEPASSAGVVASVFVREEYRNQGIGAAMLERTEEEMQRSGCRSAEIQYTTGRPEILLLEKIMMRRSWLSPKATMLSCKATSMILDAPFFRTCRLPPGFQIFPWRDLSGAEKKSFLQSQSEGGWIPDDLNPLKFEADFEPLTSVGLRRGRDVVGWLITHNTLPLSIRYTCGYVQEQLKGRGLLIPLLENTIRRQITHFPNTPGTWTVLFYHKAMVRFVLKRMAPYIVSAKEVRRSSKMLH